MPFGLHFFRKNIVTLSVKMGMNVHLIHIRIMAINTEQSIDYRPLEEAEIICLRQQGCMADDWQLVAVHPAFDATYVRNTRFIGRNVLGCFRRMFTFEGGVPIHSGIDGATLCNCVVEDDCLVFHNTGYIADTTIAHDSIVVDAGCILTTPDATFGQGVVLSVLSESGGRELTIHDRLTAQEAYVEVFYRHDAQLVERLKGMAESYARQHHTGRNHIGPHAQVQGCARLQNVHIGAYAIVRGAARLVNGTLAGSQADPVFVGSMVVAEDFIATAGACLDSGCMLTRCYVGQASAIGHGFTATDCYIGCNCQFENGEACAVFAGPYTVSHHKSTLLIGGAFSFFNAGSGTNQSNHMYKLGPCHQGVLERGCKAASGSYILWPLRAGAFSLVTGHHTRHVDTSDFPFSYLIAEGGDTTLLPGITLRNAGTLRDLRKWPQRDNRRELPPVDGVTFDVLSPYTMTKMARGLARLEHMAGAGDEDRATADGLHLPSGAVSKGIALYRMAADLFFGRELAAAMEQDASAALALVSAAMSGTLPGGEVREEVWVDAGGLIVGRHALETLLCDVRDGRLADVTSLSEAFRRLAAETSDAMRRWALCALPEWYLGSSDATGLCRDVLRRYASSHNRWVGLVADDAAKEFAPSARVSFGIDDAGMADADFEAVRGNCRSDAFFETLRVDDARVAARVETILTTLLSDDL